MAFKVVFIFAAIVACVQAGGPAAYAISAPSIDHASVGNTQEHTVKGHLGQSSQSDYSSSVTAGHAVSHVSRTSITNDGIVAPSAHGIPTPIVSQAVASPLVSHGYAAAPGPIYQQSYAAAAPVIQHGYAASVPSLAHSYLAPGSIIPSPYVPASSSYLQPAAVKVASAPIYGSGYLAQGYAPSAIRVAAAPASIGYASNVHAPGLGYGAAHLAAPAIHAAAVHAPILRAAVAAPALVHPIGGHGLHYGY